MTLNIEQEQFLDCPIELLSASSYFKQKSRMLKFYTIREIADQGWGELLKKEGFCYDWFNELIKLLESKGLLDLLEKD